MRTLKVISHHESLVLGIMAALSLGASLAISRAAEPLYQFRAVRFLGDAAPGGGAFGNDFEPTALNDFGQLAFTAEPDPNGNEAIFLADGSGVQQIMRFDQAAPGGYYFSGFELGQLGINLFGDVALAFTLGTAPGSPPDFGPPIFGGVYRWSHDTHALSAVVVPNVTAAPGGGLFHGAGFVVSLNNLGAVAFSGFVDGPNGVNLGAFVQDRSGHYRSIVRPGDPAPGGGTFVLVGAYTSINDFGDVAFAAQTSLDSTDTYRTFVRWASTGQIQAIPQPAGITVVANVNINARREIAFGGGFFAFPNGLGLGNVYLRRGNQTLLVAGVGGPAPGGRTFTAIAGANTGNQLSFNNLSDILFDAAAMDSHGQVDEAIYLYSGLTGKLRRLAGIGTQIPGGWTIANLEQPGTLTFPPISPSGVPLSNAALNDLEQVAFACTVTNLTSTRGVMLLGTPHLSLLSRDDAN